MMWYPQRWQRLGIFGIIGLLLSLALACGDPAAEDTPSPGDVTAQPASPTAGPMEPTTTPPAPADMRGGTLIRGVSALLPRGWDMRQDSVWTGPQNSGRHYDGLLEFNQQDGVTIEPGLATSWEFSSPFEEITLTLREGVQFHDGTAMAMDDVIFSFGQYQDPPAGVVFPRLSVFQSVEVIEAIDEQTVRFTLASANVDFLQQLANIWAVVVPADVAGQEGGINSPGRITGTGPFKLERAEADSFVTSSRNPDYHRVAPDGQPYPYLDGMTTIAIPEADTMVSAFRTGQIDMFQGSLEQVAAVERDLGDRIIVQQSALPGVFHLAMNATTPPFDDLRAREAMNLAIDRLQITDFMELPGVGQPWQPVSFLGNPYPFLDEIMDYREVNPATRVEAQAEARQLFEDLGITDIDMIVLPGAAFQDWAQLIAQQLSDVGVTMNLQTVDATAALTRVQAGDYQTFGHGGNNVLWSVLDIVELFYLPTGGWFYHKAAPTQEFMDLVDQARATGPGQERDELFRRMEEILREEVIPTANIMASTGTNEVLYDYVQDRHPIPAQHFQGHKFTEVWVDASSPRK